MTEATMDRTKSIGGSDSAAVLGISPWKSPLELYLEKIGELPPVDETEAMRWGTILEEPVAKEFEARTGKRVMRVNRQLVHRDHPFITAHLDRRVAREPALLEVKTTNVFARDWGEEGTDQVPEHYLAQVQHYLAVTGYQVAYVAALVGGQTLKLYTVPRNETLVEAIVDAEVRFWKQHVEPRVPPEPRTSAEASALWRNAIGRAVEATEEVAAMHRILVDTREAIKKLEAEKDYMELQLKAVLQDADQLVHEGKTLVTWKNVTAKKFDAKAVQAAMPDLTSRFTKETTYRRFVVKEDKEEDSK